MNNPCGFASLALSDQKFNKATAWCIEMRQENICTFILDLQLFEIIFNNRSLPLWPTEKAHTAEYRLHTGCSKRQSVPARAPSCPVWLLRSSLPCYTTNCVVLPSARKLPAPNIGSHQSAARPWINPHWGIPTATF